MPGSNTPNPPGSKIQSCPGCQTRTSSFQVMVTRSILRLGEQLPRRLDRRRVARMPGREQGAPRPVAAATSGAISLTVAPGGFSSITCLRAASAVAACACRTCGGVHSATASISGPSRSKSVEGAECGTPGKRRVAAGDRHQFRARRRRRSPAHAGRARSCRSRRSRYEARLTFYFSCFAGNAGHGIRRMQRRIADGGLMPGDTVVDHRRHRLGGRLRRPAPRSHRRCAGARSAPSRDRAGSTGALSRNDARSAASITPPIERMNGLPEALATAMCSARSPSANAVGIGRLRCASYPCCGAVRRCRHRCGGVAASAAACGSTASRISARSLRKRLSMPTSRCQASTSASNMFQALRPRTTVPTRPWWSAGPWRPGS